MTKKIPNQRLRRERELRGWSRSYVAEQLQSDPQTVARWERGETSPSPQLRQKLCELFEKNAEELGLIREDSNNHVSPGNNVLPDLSSAPPTSREKSEPHEDKFTTTESEGNRSATAIPRRPLSSSILFGRRPSWKKLLVGLAIVIGLVIWLAPTFQRLVVATIRPGGLWIRPIQGETIKDTLHFAVHAYPTRVGDPSIDHVNFTIMLPGLSYWRIACTVRPTAGTDIFTCDVKLKDFQAAAGEARVSFDVYDVAGHVNKAPNGVHTILYAPS